VKKKAWTAPHPAAKCMPPRLEWEPATASPSPSPSRPHHPSVSGSSPRRLLNPEANPNGGPLLLTRTF
jgi:hypothetical protein